MTPGRRAITATLTLTALSVLLIYGLLDPATMPFPKCPVLVITGYECPGCGSQRAIHSILTGHLSDAWHYNALMVASIPVIALMLAASATRTRYPRLYNTLNSRTAIISWVTIIVAWTVWRNIF